MAWRGADGYLTDVLEPLELIATVNALLRARRAEEAAQLTARQWQMTFDAISDGVVLLDGNGKILNSTRPCCGSWASRRSIPSLERSMTYSG